MYGKLYDTIFGSSIMEEDVEIRYIWMCMLAVADRDGFVDQTIPALARRFNIAEDLMNKSIEIFLSPDPSSRTQDHAGKRLEPIRESFGWKIINYEKYRDMKNEDERREYMKTYMRTYRKSLKKPPVNNCKQQLTKLAYTDTDTDTDTDNNKVPDFIPKDLLKAFKENRKKLKRPMTEKAEELLIKKITKLKDQGQDPTQMLERAIEGGWLSVYPDKDIQPQDDLEAQAKRFMERHKENK